MTDTRTELEKRADDEAAFSRSDIANELIGDFNPNDRDDVYHIKHAAKAMATAILQHCPEGRRQSIALTRIEEAAMMAVKSLYEQA